MFWFDQAVGTARCAFTDRFGGVSTGPYAEFNVGNSAGDDPGAVTENLGLLAEAFAVPRSHLVRMRQVHGADVFVVGDNTDVIALSETPPLADAVVTRRRDLALCVRVADCVPLLLVDSSASVLGAAHAGRSGLAAGVVPATLAAMRRLGARQVTAVLGPHVCGSCYEVPDAMRTEVAAAVPAAGAHSRWGTPALDLGAGVTAQLVTAGCQVLDSGGCTIESDKLFSYRRLGRTSGRLAGVVGWR